MAGVRFTKVEGAGNDYVLVDVADRRVADAPALARAVADRHTGIGSDGLLLVGPGGDGADATMRIFNADGSEGLMCGNGLRCVVSWLARAGRLRRGECVIATASGPRRGRLGDGGVEVSMGRPDFRAAAVPVDADGEPPALAVPDELRADPDRAFAVSIGNPHLVVAVADPAAVDLAVHGAALCASPRLPHGANVHFVRRAGGALLARTWERGSGATRACGSGAVAIAAVARRLGWIRGPRAVVSMPGGDLGVRWDDGGEAWLSGPARLVFDGEWPES